MDVIQCSALRFFLNEKAYTVCWKIYCGSRMYVVKPVAYYFLL